MSTEADDEHEPTEFEEWFARTWLYDSPVVDLRKPLDQYIDKAEQVFTQNEIDDSVGLYCFKNLIYMILRHRAPDLDDPVRLARAASELDRWARHVTFAGYDMAVYAWDNARELILGAPPGIRGPWGSEAAPASPGSAESESVEQQA